MTNVASALGTRVSLFKDAGARLKTEARVVILLPGMREMPSISSQDESGLDKGIFFSPNSSCLLLLLNHRLIFFFLTHDLAMWLSLALNVQAEVASASKELGTGSTDVHQHFWLGPQFVEISGKHF